jgi:hypothetical protein
MEMTIQKVLLTMPKRQDALRTFKTFPEWSIKNRYIIQRCNHETQVLPHYTWRILL